MDPSCQGNGNDGDCNPSHVLWEDGGPPMDESLYAGWLTMNIDGTRSCIMVKLFS